MSVPLTIIIPTHNRHNYLRRAISYYSNTQYPVIILDSSQESFKSDFKENFTYFHLPKLSLPEKLVYGFSKTNTEFVIMCADDDFLIIDGIEECLSFLQQNRHYAVADGGILFYKKEDIFKNLINFNLLYKIDLDYNFDDKNPLNRLNHFFKNYRTVFYGIHYTKNLIYIFEQCSKSYSNLFLNEYLTTLFPIAKGFCRILPVITAVREFTDASGDKTTMNLDKMISGVNVSQELENYINCVSKAISFDTGIQIDECKKTVMQVLTDYAEIIKASHLSGNPQHLSATKKIGNFISKIPVIGLSIVRKRRLAASKREISALVKTEKDKKNLDAIEQQILKFQSTC